MRSVISDHVFEVVDGRLRIVQRLRVRSVVVADVPIEDIVSVEIGQTRKAGMKRQHSRFGRTRYRSFTGRSGMRLVHRDDEADYLDLPGTPDEIAEAVAEVLDDVQRRGGTVLL